MPSVAEGYHIGPGKSTTVPSWQKAPLSSTELEQGSVISDVSEQVCACLLSCFSCVQICDPMHCSRPGSSVHGILQARILEWVAMPSSRGSSGARDQTCISCIAGRFFTAKPLGKPPAVFRGCLKGWCLGSYCRSTCSCCDPNLSSNSGVWLAKEEEVTMKS